MIKRFKNLSALKGKKRYIVLGLLAFELMSLPAAANIIQQAAFAEQPLVTAVEIPTAEPGLSRYLVTSTAGFDVTVDNAIGEIKTTVHTSGILAGSARFGDAAQLPGEKVGCATSTDHDSTIYKANRTTASKSGTAPEQAVVFEFQYSPDQQADFEFIAGEISDKLVTGCESKKV